MTHPRQDPWRRCRPVHKWPTIDQSLWLAAIRRGDVLDEAGALAHLRPQSLHKLRRGYGRFLTFVAQHGYLDEETQPASRVTVEVMRHYLSELSEQVSPYTRLARIAELLAVMEAFHPERDWSWLRAALDRLHAARPVGRNKRPLIRDSGEIFWTAHRALQAIIAEGLPDKCRAWRFQDALLLAFLAARPLRRSNLAALSMGSSLIPAGETWTVSFEGQEMKNGLPFSAPLPGSLAAMITVHLERFRPILLGRRRHERLFVDYHGNPMTGMGLYHRVRKAAQLLLGTAMNPHLFRDCAATSIALQDPEHVLNIRDLLGHTTPRTAERYYNQAQSIEASRAHQRAIRSLRRRSPLPID